MSYLFSQGKSIFESVVLLNAFSFIRFPPLIKAEIHNRVFFTHVTVVYIIVYCVWKDSSAILFLEYKNRKKFPEKFRIKATATQKTALW